MAFGVFGRHVMVAGGTAVTGTAVPHTFVGDLATGDDRSSSRSASARGAARPDDHGLPATAVRNLAASVDALVAGGADPDSRNAPLATAEVYVPKLGAAADVGDFDQTRIDLSEPRAEHGAVVLASGETLLVGGRGGAEAPRAGTIDGDRRPSHAARARTTGSVTARGRALLESDRAPLGERRDPRRRRDRRARQCRPHARVVRART